MIRDGLDRQSTIGQKRRFQRKAMRDGGRGDGDEIHYRDVDDGEEEELRSDEEMSAEEPLDETDDAKDGLAEADDDRTRIRTERLQQGRHKRRPTDYGEGDTQNSEQEDDNEEQDDEEDVDNKYHGCNQHDNRVVSCIWIVYHSILDSCVSVYNARKTR